MMKENRETEVKFYIKDLSQIESKLREVKAQLISARTFEVNLRFDTAYGDLERAGRVVRLRKDDRVRLTYKDNSQNIAGAVSRREIEFVVEDFDSAKQFIEALGYEVVFIYEKYRTTYAIQTSNVLKDLRGLETHIMLDELPYGNFIEIEGEMDQLRVVANELRLDWSKAIPASYHALFERLRKARGLMFRDLTFENFKGSKVSPEDMMIEYADSNTII